MYKYINPNPCKRLVDDCAIRAISIIQGISWKQTYVDLCNRGLMICDLPNSAATISLYLKEKGFERKVVSSDCPACYTIRDFCEEYPYGDYILLTDGHAVAVIDGNFYDTTDSGDLSPIYYWERRKEHGNVL